MIYAFIVLGALSRLVPHPANFAPVAALALFGGANLRRRDAIIVPLLTMLVSDLFISGYYGTTMFYVYGSFILIGIIGLWLRTHKSPVTILASSLFASSLFFTVTNFGVWTGNWYPHTLAGLAETYTAAIPFFRNTILGDMFYTGLFFGGFELAVTISKKLAPLFSR